MPYFAIRCEYAASESRRKTHETCVRASCLPREAETVVDRAAGPARPASPTLSKHCGSTVAGGGAQATARAVSNVDLRRLLHHTPVCSCQSGQLLVVDGPKAHPAAGITWKCCSERLGGGTASRHSIGGSRKLRQRYKFAAPTPHSRRILSRQGRTSLRRRRGSC